MADTVAHQLGAVGHAAEQELEKTSRTTGKLTELLVSVVVVAAFGALGGILAYYAKVADGNPIGGGLWTAALLGAGAGFIGVNLFVRGASVREAKTLAMALAFGITWKPVMAAVDSWSAAQLNERDAALVQDAAKKLKGAAEQYLAVPAATRRRQALEPEASKAPSDEETQQLRQQATEVSVQLDAVLNRKRAKPD
jgi:hypothetical protein